MFTYCSRDSVFPAVHFLKKKVLYIASLTFYWIMQLVGIWNFVRTRLPGAALTLNPSLHLDLIYRTGKTPELYFIVCLYMSFTL